MKEPQGSFFTSEIPMKFKIFTTQDCRFCKLAKSALDARGFDYEEVEADAEARAQLIAIGLKTVPQIYLIPMGDKPAQHIGGYTDLVAFFAQMESEK